MGKALTMEVRVCESSDRKMLEDGTRRVYPYGMISIRSADLKPFVGQMVRVTVIPLGTDRIRRPIRKERT